MSYTNRARHRAIPRGSAAHQRLLREEQQVAAQAVPVADGQGPAIVDCPRCENGTVTVHDGDMWWQVRKLRCSWCRGTGRVYADETGGAA